RARRGQSGLPCAPEAPGLPDARRTSGRAQESRPAQGAQGAAVLEALAPSHRASGVMGACPGHQDASSTSPARVAPSRADGEQAMRVCYPSGAIYGIWFTWNPKEPTAPGMKLTPKL